MNNKFKEKNNIKLLWDAFKELIKSYISLADLVFFLIAIISYLISRDLKISGIIIFVSLLYTSCYLIAGYKSQLKHLQSNVSLRVEFRNVLVSNTEIDASFIQPGIESILKAILINEGEDEENIKITIYIPNEINPSKIDLKPNEVDQKTIEQKPHTNAYAIYFVVPHIQGIMGKSELGLFHFNLPINNNYQFAYQVRVEFETDHGIGKSGSSLNILSSQALRLIPKKDNTPKIPY